MASPREKELPMVDKKSKTEKKSEVEEKVKKLPIAEIEDAIRKHSSRGNPQNGAKLRYLYDNDLPIPSELLDFTGLRPEKETVGKLEPPPRVGPGSGKERWIEFATEVSDLGVEVLEKMNRDEIIDILETRGIIPEIEESK